MFEAVAFLVGGSFSEWSWFKVSFPISYRGLGVRRALLYAPAAFIGSFDHSKELVSDILGRTPPSSNHLADMLKDLASASGQDEWSSLERIDVPLRQHALSRVIDQACFDQLFARAPDVHAKALALSSSIPHAGD